MVFPSRYQEDVQIKPDDRHMLSEEEATFTLTISDTTLDDDAEYTCTATNTAGSASTSADLFVNTAGEHMLFLRICLHQTLQAVLLWRQ